MPPLHLVGCKLSGSEACFRGPLGGCKSLRPVLFPPGFDVGWNALRALVFVIDLGGFKAFVGCFGPGLVSSSLLMTCCNVPIMRTKYSI